MAEVTLLSMTMLAVTGCAVLVALTGASFAWSATDAGLGLEAGEAVARVGLGLGMVGLATLTLVGLNHHLERDQLDHETNQRCVDMLYSECGEVPLVEAPAAEPEPAPPVGPDAAAMAACVQMCGSTGVSAWYGPYSGRSTRCVCE